MPQNPHLEWTQPPGSLQKLGGQKIVDLTNYHKRPLTDLWFDIEIFEKA